MVLGVQDMPSSRTIDITLTEGTSMAAAASPDRQWMAIDLLGSLWILPMRGGEAKRITPELLDKYLAFPKVFACGGSWMVTKELLAGKQFDRIAELSRDAVQRAQKARPNAM